MFTKTTLRKILLFLLIKCQMLCAGLSLFLVINHFGLTEYSLFYYPLGTFSVLLMLLALVPFPSEREQDYIERIISNNNS
ncbi:MAG: hypothetical protein ACI4XL_07905 [Bacillus sp. (in: firmicutes)]